MNSSKIPLLIATALIALACGVIGGGLYATYLQPETPTLQNPGEGWREDRMVVEVRQPVVELDGIRPDGSTDIAAVGAAVSPSVVTLRSRPGEAREGQVIQRNLVGSGVVAEVGGEAVVITNKHVLDGGVEIEVEFSDGRIYPGEVLGRDTQTDLAVVRPRGAEDLRAVSFGSSDSLAVGDEVVAVGHPGALGGEPAVTWGVLAGRDRSIETRDGSELYGMLQVAVGLMQGSSGGALVDHAGQLVGITTAVGTEGSGVGFAIPVEVVETVAAALITNGEATPLGLGAELWGTVLNLSGGGAVALGIEVRNITPGGPLEVAGIQEGEIITTFDGVSVRSPDVVIGRLARYTRGDQVQLEVATVTNSEAGIFQTREVVITFP